MGSVRRSVLFGTFRSIVEQGFRFLIEEYGFFGPEVESIMLRYYSRDLSLEVTLSEREAYVQTYITGLVAGRELRAELSCLFVACGLGPAQRVGWSARTVHAMTKSLQSQSGAAGEVLSRLRGAERNDLLTRCHGA